MSGSSIVSQPRVTIGIEGAQENIGNSPQQILIVGAFNPATATATSAVLTENVPNNNGAINTLFGAKSHIASLARSLRKMNSISKIDAIAIDATSLTTAATATVTVAGTATASGSFQLVVGSYKDHKLTINVASGDTATVIGDAIDTAVAADTSLQVASVNSSGTVVLTASDKGLTGNVIPLQIVSGSSVAGVTAVVTAGFASGAGDLATAGLFDVIGNERYQTVVYPSTSDVSILTDLLDARWNADNIVLDGVGVVGSVGTYSQVLAVGAAQNSQSLMVIGSKSVATNDLRGSSMVEFLDNVSAQFAGVRARRLTDGALISDLVVGSAALDAFGGSALASRPLFNTPFAYLPLIGIGYGWSNSEIELLLASGISIVGSNRTRTGVLAGEIVTTYKTDAASNPDESFNFLNKVDTSSQCREYFHNNIKKAYAQTRLTTGSLVSGRPMANEASIRGYLMSLYADLSGSDYALTVAGEASQKVFAENMTVTIDMSQG
jgi:phage tail sheath gpL-like